MRDTAQRPGRVRGTGSLPHACSEPDVEASAPPHEWAGPRASQKTRSGVAPLHSRAAWAVSPAGCSDGVSPQVGRFLRDSQPCLVGERTYILLLPPPSWSQELVAPIQSRATWA